MAANTLYFQYKHIIRNLDNLEKKIQRKVIRNSMKKTGKIIQMVAKSSAPMRTGNLRNEIKVKVFTKKGRVKVAVGFFKGFYGMFLEVGHFAGRRQLKNRIWVPAKPFLRPALARNKNTFKNDLMQNIRGAINAIH